jgi:hypothetical protein
MFKKIKEFFTGKPAEIVAEVPYKVEATPVVEVVPAGTEASIAAPVAVAKAAPKAKKAPAAKKTATPKAKKPRAPRAPK